MDGYLGGGSRAAITVDSLAYDFFRFLKRPHLDLEGIDHTRTKAKSPQTNGICERFHQTIQNEFYATAFRRKVYTSLEQLQQDADEWVRAYNEERTHSGKHCFGKTPWQTFVDSKALALAKQLDRTHPTTKPAV